MADVERGCGSRVAGGLYLTCPLVPFGLPVEHFLIDEPIHQVDVENKMVPIAEAFRLSARGVTITEIPALGPGHHVIDWVGAEHYPNVADFVEEVRHFGVSRRISSRADFSKLTRDSRIVLAHPKAWIDDWIIHYRTERAIKEGPEEETHTFKDCPRDGNQSSHTDWPDETCCARWWWQDVVGGEPSPTEEPRKVFRQMPSFGYEAHEPPEGADGKHSLALFAAFPIVHIEAIMDREGMKHEQSMKKAEKSTIPVRLEEA